ncbi:MAG: DNA-binding protein [Clostridiales bacterium]|nr:DNA-binding protein [Clostridiales bacterium]
MQTHEKDLSISDLLDHYGAILSERRRYVLELYYNDDLSLAEIAENTGISRQGVRDLIKKGEAELYRCEEALGNAAAYTKLKDEVEAISKELYSLAESIDQTGQSESGLNISQKLSELAERVLALAGD